MLIFFVDKGVLCGIWRERGCFGDMALIKACAHDTNVYLWKGHRVGANRKNFQEHAYCCKLGERGIRKGLDVNFVLINQ